MPQMGETDTPWNCVTDLLFGGYMYFLHGVVFHQTPWGHFLKLIHDNHPVQPRDIIFRSHLSLNFSCQQPQLNGIRTYWALPKHFKRGQWKFIGFHSQKWIDDIPTVTGFWQPSIYVHTYTHIDYISLYIHIIVSPQRPLLLYSILLSTKPQLDCSSTKKHLPAVIHMTCLPPMCAATIAP